MQDGTTASPVQGIRSQRLRLELPLAWCLRVRIFGGVKPPANGTPEPHQKGPETPDRVTDADTCDVCGSDRLEWRLCKLICGNCRAIVKSCADL